MIHQVGALQVRNSQAQGLGLAGHIGARPTLQVCVFNTNERGWALAAQKDGCGDALNTSSVKYKQNIQGFLWLEAPFASLH